MDHEMEFENQEIPQPVENQSEPVYAQVQPELMYEPPVEPVKKKKKREKNGCCAIVAVAMCFPVRCPRRTAVFT